MGWRRVQSGAHMAEVFRKICFWMILTTSDITWSAVYSSVLTRRDTREAWMYWRHNSKRPQRILRSCRISEVMKGWGSWDCQAWRRKSSGRILSISINTQGRDAKKAELGCFLWCPVAGQHAGAQTEKDVVLSEN